MVLGCRWYRIVDGILVFDGIGLLAVLGYRWYRVIGGIGLSMV